MAKPVIEKVPEFKALRAVLAVGLLSITACIPLKEIPDPSPSTSPTPSSSPSPAPRSGLQVTEIPDVAVSWWTTFVIDSADNTYVPDLNQDGVIKTSPDGSTTRFLAGSNSWVLTKDSRDNVYVITGTGGLGGSPPMATLAFRKISPDGAVTLICDSSDCRQAAAIAFYGVGAVDSLGNLFVSQGDLISRITPSGTITPFVGGNGTPCADGNGAAAHFHGIRSLTIDAFDQLFVLDANTSGQTFDHDCSGIKKVTPNGDVTTLHTFANDFTTSMTVDSHGNLFYIVPIQVGLTGALIRKLTPSGVETTYCGAPWAGDGTNEGNCSHIFIWVPSGWGMAFDASGNLILNQTKYDTDTNALFRIAPGP